MTTARELITDALGDIGVLDPNETLSGEQANHGLRTLNRIIDRWNAQSLHVWTVVDVVGNFAGASATIGPGLTFNTPHPLRLEPGCYYVKSGMSYPLPIWSREDYNAVILKSTAGDYPQGVYYDKQIPGHVYVWPVPSVSTEYHLQATVQMAEFADLDTDYTFPAGYKDALFYTLVERLPQAYNLTPDPDQKAEAAKARAVIRKNNARVPVLSATNGRSGRLNILTNQFQ